jgi:hypothetical protein
MTLPLRPFLPESTKARQPDEFGARIVTSVPSTPGARRWFGGGGNFAPVMQR